MSRFFLISPLILQTLIWPIVRPLFRVFLHLKISGQEHVSLPCKYDRTYMVGRGTIFAVNHTSELDAVLVPGSLPFLSPLSPMFYTSRERSFYKHSGWRQFLYGGFIFEIWGAHAVHPGKHDYAESLKTHIKLLQHGKSVCIFPHGKKVRPGEPEPEARGGVAYLAWRTKAPIIPVHVENAGSTSIWEFFARKRHVCLTFGAPIDASELFHTDAPQVEDFKRAAFEVLRRIALLSAGEGRTQNILLTGKGKVLS